MALSKNFSRKILHFFGTVFARYGKKMYFMHMKKIVFISAILMAMMSCTKALDNEKVDEVSNIEFTNTVTCNGTSYELSEVEIEVNDYDYEDIGLSEPFFYIDGQGKKITSEVNTSYGHYSEYDFVGFSVAIPTSNYGKMCNLLKRNTYGAIGFGKGSAVEEVITGVGWTQSITKVEGASFISTAEGDSSNKIEDGDSKPMANPKVAKYYIEVERTYEDFYKLYVEFEDADGNKYVLSYKGEKEK